MPDLRVIITAVNIAKRLKKRYGSAENALDLHSVNDSTQWAVFCRPISQEFDRKTRVFEAGRGVARQDFRVVATNV
jgi:hypothetical protein